MTDPFREKTVLTSQYATDRIHKRSHRYRLSKRTAVVQQAIEKWCIADPLRVLDVGTADGKMMALLSKQYPSNLIVGVEYAADLSRLAAAANPQIPIIRADAHSLPFKTDTFDLVIATAVLEHLEQPLVAMAETLRILCPKAILIVTSPSPVWEEIATRVGHLNEEQHACVMSIPQIITLLQNCGFRILETKKFMFSPVGFPCEEMIERFMRILKLDFLMANQLIVAEAD